MSRRIFSFVLCLPLLLSLITPAVSAADGGVYIDDEIYIDNSSSVSNLTIDGENVILSDEAEEAEERVAYTEPAQPVPVTEAVPETEAVTEPARETVPVTEAATEPVPETEPTGEASATTEDGTTVNVAGIPEGGSVVVEPALYFHSANTFGDGKSRNPETMIFAWDISVQDATGADWQPEGTVRVELDVPGVKLHKYTQVYVLHIDDQGNESRIEASVTEEGKVAFETPGFSTFAGFTVDFAYEGVEFSIPGETSILLSELFEQLRAPLYIEDVADVVFSDETLITVTKVDGDWELKSLVAFDTTETLTITMSDGKVYEITVTDYHSDGIWEDTWTVNSTGDNFKESNTPNISTTTSSVWNFATSKVHNITITRGSYNGQKVTINLRQMSIKDEVEVNFALDETFDGSNVKEVVFKANNTWALIYLQEGKISFKGRENTRIVLENRLSTSTNPSNYPTIYAINGSKSTIDLEYVTFRNTDRGALGLCADRIPSVSLKNCIFESTVSNKYYGGGAIFVSDVYQKTNGNEFHSVTPLTHGNNYSDVTLMTIDGCSFNGVKTTAATDKLGYGGAIGIFGKVDKLEIKNSTFTNCTAYCGGGAISIGGSAGMVDISGCSFTGCEAQRFYGGAIHTWTRRIKFPTESGNTYGRYTRVNTLKITDTRFQECKAPGQDGGGVGIQGQLHTLNISGRTQFIDCEAYTRGGAICLASITVPDYGTTLSGCSGKLYFTSGYEDTQTYGEVNATVQNYNTAVTKDNVTTYYDYKYTTIKNVSITGQISTSFNSKTPGTTPTFWTVDGGVTKHQAGFLAVAQYSRVDSLVLDRMAIRDCETFGEGSCIYLHGSDILSFEMKNCWVQGCDFTKNENGLYLSKNLVGGTIRTIGNTGVVMTLDNCYFTNNKSIINGGAIYFNANADKRKDYETQDPLFPDGCSATISNCNFYKNSALRDGGAIYCESNVTVENCLIHENTARRGGGIAQQIYNNEGRPIENGEATRLKLDEDTEIYNNNAKEYSGGLVEADILDASGNVVTEKNMYVDEMKADGGHGGGISIVCNYTAALPQNTTMAYPVEFVLGGASVYGNKADNNGGGIYYLTVTSAPDSWQQKQVDHFVKKITIDDGNIFSNQAGVTGSGHGGGIYMNSSQVNDDATGTTTLLITGGKIYSNTANNGDGGGIYLTGRKAICSISGGTVGGGSFTEDAKGKLTATADTATPNHAIRSGTTATGRGGGIAITGGARIEMTKGDPLKNEDGTVKTDKDGNIIYDKGVISFNKADYQGGGIWLDAKGSDADAVANTMSLSDGQILFNDVTAISANSANGGGVYVGNHGEFTLSNGEVKHNNTTAWGGGMYCTQGKLDITGGIISYNTTGDTDAHNSGAGGGIALQNAATAEIKGGSICYNTSKGGGGVFLTADSADLVCKITITYDSASAVPESADALTEDTLGIHSNTANGSTDGGGGIWANTYTSVEVNQGNIMYNSADSASGGGIYCFKANILVKGGTIAKNTAKNGGGICALRRSTYGVEGAYQKVTVQGGEIRDNTATEKGGGIYAAAHDVVVSKTATSAASIRNNNAKTGGGVAVDQYTEGTLYATFNMTGGTIEGNTAVWGGGIAALNSATATVNGGSVIGNTVTPTDDMELGYHENGAVDAATTANGGGIYAQAASVTVSNGSVENNTADFYGGGVYAENGSTVTVSGGNVKNNTAINGHGGGVHVAINSTANIQGGSIIGNTSTNGNGGGVHAFSNCTVSITTGNITLNNAKNGNGGGIALQADSTATMGGGDVTYNNAKNGGGIYVTEGSNLTINNGQVTHNNAIGMPSGLTTAYQLNGTLAGTGGGIYVADGVGADNRSTFTMSGTSNVAIHSNLADFAADDVFANSVNTDLNVPVVRGMNLNEYDLPAGGWFEDYPVNDTNYTSGLNSGPSNFPKDCVIKDGSVWRYRFSKANERAVIIPTNSLDANTLPANNVDTYVCMTLGIPSANPDTIVLDYGLDVQIDVLTNDVVLALTGSKTKLIGFLPGGTVPADYVKFESGKAPTAVNGSYEITVNGKKHTVTSTYGGAFGRFSVLNKKVKYTPTKNGALDMNNVEQIVYAVSYDPELNTGETYYFFSTINIVPANTIYYEDDFVTTKVYTRNKSTVGGKVTYGTWTQSMEDGKAKQWDSYAEGSKGDGFQTESRPGAGDIYGYDSDYDNCLKMSHAAGRSINVSATQYGTAEFTFWGTGFDVISATSWWTGFLTVQITPLKAADGTVYTAAQQKEMQINKAVDTFYGYKYENGKWTAITSGGQAIYQVPIIKHENLPYGQYKVVLTASYSKYFDHVYADDTGDYTLYLDAVRIYDPIPENKEFQDTTVEDVYLDDGQAHAFYQELRNKLIDSNSFNALGSASITGAVFVDGISKVENGSNNTHNSSTHVDSDRVAQKVAAIRDYANYGPNNEVYLASGQAVAFNLVKADTYNRVYIGLKSGLSGNAAQVSIYGIKDGERKDIFTQKNINTSTDMYYDITGLIDHTVVIESTGTNLLSVTTLKFATGRVLSSDGQEPSYITMDRQSGQAVLELINGFSEDEVETDVIPEETAPVDPEIPDTQPTEPEVTEPEETQPETTEPEATEPETTEPEATEPDADEPDSFKPEKLEVKLSNSSVKVGSQVMVTVTTGEDVAYLTVNGAKVTFFTEENGQRIWRVRLTAKEVGGMAIRVVAYNGTGAASQTAMKILEVTDSYTGIGNWLEDLIIRIVSNLTK